MKKSAVVLSATVIVFVMLLFAFRPAAVSSITGRINPADATEAIWAISGKDSVKSSLMMGAFSIEVKPGTYSIIVDAKPPFKDRVIDNVPVMSEQSVNIGEITLEQ